MLELKNLRFSFGQEAGRADDIYRGAIEQGAKMLLWSDPVIGRTFQEATKNVTVGVSDEQQALAAEAEFETKFLKEIEQDPRILSFAAAARDVYEAGMAAVERDEWPDLLPWQVDALEEQLTSLELDDGDIREGGDTDLKRLLKLEYGFGDFKLRL